MATIVGCLLLLLVCAIQLPGGEANSGVPCGNAPKIDHSSVKVNTTTSPYISAVYTCDSHHGYVLNGNATIFCVPVQGYNVWSRANFTCNRIDNPCGAPPEVSNAVAVVNTSETSLVTAVYKCNSSEGYILKGNNTIACLAVFDYVVWSSINFTCDRVQCTNELQIKNDTTMTDYKRAVRTSKSCSYYERNYRRNGCSYYSRVIYHTTYTPKDVYYGGHVNVTCREGYEYPDNITESKIDCGVDGKWIYPNLTCQPVDCGPIDIYEGVKCEEKPTIFPTTVTCRCAAGYERILIHPWINVNLTANVYNISCTGIGYWSPPNDTLAPNCTRIQCEEPPAVLHSTNDVTGYYINDTTSYQCDPGFFAYGNTTINCQQNGNWTSAPECRDVRNPCGEPPDVVNATVIINKTSSLVTATYSCDASQGYVLRGNDTITCVKVSDYGVWSSVNITCERVRCDHHPVVENTTTSIDYVTTTRISKRCSYYQRDYGRNGCSYYTYTYYETTSTSSAVYYGGIVNVTCRDGYQFPDNITKTQIVCGANAQWIYPNQSCQPKDCGPIESVEGVTCENKPTVFPTQVECKCVEGYERNVSSGNYKLNQYGDPVRDANGLRVYTTINDVNYKLSCTTLGVWSNPDDSSSRACTRVFCPPPRTIEHSETSRTIVRGVRYQDTVTYMCMLGYVSEVNLTTSCQANKTWLPMPRCVGKDCGYPPVLTNGYIKGGRVTNTLVGASVEYECAVGFEILGTAQSRCGEGGRWSTLPICHRIRCGEPPVLSHSRRHVGGHYFDDTTTYVCDSGFTIYGSAVTYCQFDGHWTAPPECLAKSCGSPPKVAHATAIIQSGLQFGDQVDYVCFKGFNLSGNSFVTCLPSGDWSVPPTCQPANGNSTFASDADKIPAVRPHSARRSHGPRRNHTALTAAMIALAVIVGLVLLVIGCRYFVKWRRKRDHRIVSSVHNALYNSDGDRMTLYSFKNPEENGNHPSTENQS